MELEQKCCPECKGKGWKLIRDIIPKFRECENCFHGWVLKNWF